MGKAHYFTIHELHTGSNSFRIGCSKQHQVILTVVQLAEEGGLREK
jgi:hypothetical protein